MNITSLQTFIAIVESGSLVRASEKMNVTQSTVTARVKTLEQEMGQVLLNRQKSGTTLTPAGSKLLRYAHVMVGLWRQAHMEAGLPSGTHSLCTLGCHSDIWAGPGKLFFERLATQQQDMGVSVHRGNQQEMEDWLSSGIVDVVMTYSAFSRGQHTIHELNPDKLVLYSDRPDSSISCDPGYIYVDYGREYRRGHGEAYFDAGTAKIAFDSPGWALGHVLDHGGSAYLPSHLADRFLRDKALYRLESAPVFERKKFLIVNETAKKNWPWFDDLIKGL